MLAIGMMDDNDPSTGHKQQTPCYEHSTPVLEDLKQMQSLSYVNTFLYNDVDQNHQIEVVICTPNYEMNTKKEIYKTHSP